MPKPALACARAKAAEAPVSVTLSIAVTCWCRCAWPQPRTPDLKRRRRLTADDERGTAVGHRAAVEQLQRRGDQTRAHDLLHRDRLVELGAGMRQRVAAHQHGEFGEVFFRHTELMHVA